MRIGSITALYRYPVKALRAEPLERADVLADGLAGDRASALFVRSDGHARSGKTYRGKEHNLLHTLTTAAAGAALAAQAGLAVEAEDSEPHYFDARPVSLVFDRWLAELAQIAGRPIDPLRFRPNVVAAADRDFAVREADLVGARLRLGTVELDVVEPIVRCVTPSYDVASGATDPEMHRFIAVDRGNIMGVYCTVVRPGTLAVGAEIERIAR